MDRHLNFAIFHFHLLQEAKGTMQSFRILFSDFFIEDIISDHLPHLSGIFGFGIGDTEEWYAFAWRGVLKKCQPLTLYTKIYRLIESKRRFQDMSSMYLFDSVKTINNISSGLGSLGISCSWSEAQDTVLLHGTIEATGPQMYHQ